MTRKVLKIHKWGETVLDRVAVHRWEKVGAPLCGAFNCYIDLWTDKDDTKVTCKRCLKIMEKKK